MPGDVFCPKCAEYREYETRRKTESFEVRGERVEVPADVAVCKTCGEEVFLSDLDSATLAAAYDEYRRRHGLLLPMEIREIREEYGLSQRAFSRLLNWGEVTIHRYESGSIQDRSHNDMLVLLRDPGNMKRLLEHEHHRLGPKELARIEGRLHHLLGSSGVAARVQDTLARGADIYSGFRSLDLERLANAVVFFAAREAGLLKTKLLKLLWFSDFLCFKRYTLSISGARYVHLPYGPVPERYELLLGSLDGGAIDVIPIEVFGYMGEEIRPGQEFDAEMFSPDENEVLADIFAQFKGFNCAEISAYVHEERAYRETKDGEVISYEWARELRLS